MLSLPLPKVTLPVIAPLPPAGKVRELLPCRSVSAAALPLSHMWLSLPAVGENAQSAGASSAASEINASDPARSQEGEWICVLTVISGSTRGDWRSQPDSEHP
ncbi:hypothetical protein D3C78_1223170 [compost metagenome]